MGFNSGFKGLISSGDTSSDISGDTSSDISPSLTQSQLIDFGLWVFCRVLV